MGSALFNLILLIVLSKPWVDHYTVSLVFNPILGSFIYSNEDTLAYLKRKKQNWQNGRKLNNRVAPESGGNQMEMGPWMRGSGTRNAETNFELFELRPVSNAVSIINIGD